MKMAKERIPHPAPFVCAALFGFGLAALLTMTVAVAGQYYRWIDSSGNLYIGDQPPPGGVGGALPLPLPEYAPPERSPEDDPYSIINQTKRLKEQREALARQRLEKRSAEREYLLRKRELEAMQEPPPQRTVPVYVYPQIHFSRPPLRPWHPRPSHPRPWSGDRHVPENGYSRSRLGPPHRAPGTRLDLGQ
jgi:hypothetical protein